MDPYELATPEGDYTQKNFNPEGRGWDAERYAEWMKAGHQPPPIEVVEYTDGGLGVINGHRRTAAAKMAGEPILAWVSPAVESGRVDASGRPMKTGLTWEIAKHHRGTLTPEELESLPDLKRAVEGLPQDPASIEFDNEQRESRDDERRAFIGEEPESPSQARLARLGVLADAGATDLLPDEFLPSDEELREDLENAIPGHHPPDYAGLARNLEEEIPAFRGRVVVVGSKGLMIHHPRGSVSLQIGPTSRYDPEMCTLFVRPEAEPKEIFHQWARATRRRSSRPDLPQYRSLEDEPTMEEIARMGLDNARRGATGTAAGDERHEQHRPQCRHAETSARDARAFDRRR